MWPYWQSPGLDGVLSALLATADELTERKCRDWQILLQKSATVMTRRQPGFWKGLVISLLLGAGHPGISLAGWTADMHWARWTCIDHRWRMGDQLYEPAKILRDRCQHELKLRTAWPA